METKSSYVSSRPPLQANFTDSGPAFSDRNPKNQALIFLSLALIELWIKPWIEPWLPQGHRKASLREEKRRRRRRQLLPREEVYYNRNRLLIFRFGNRIGS